MNTRAETKYWWGSLFCGKSGSTQHHNQCSEEVVGRDLEVLNLLPNKSIEICASYPGLRVFERKLRTLRIIFASANDHTTCSVGLRRYPAKCMQLEDDATKSSYFNLFVLGRIHRDALLTHYPCTSTLGIKFKAEHRFHRTHRDRRYNWFVFEVNIFGGPGSLRFCTPRKLSRLCF